MQKDIIVIITHTDPDGWFAEWVVRQYIETIDTQSTIARFNYSYSPDISEIEQFVAKNADRISDIYITDVTMPDEFMSRYAPLITHLDHHVSAMTDATWKSQLKHDYSAVTRKGYKDTKRQQAEQISACELAWTIFFPKRKMPKTLRYVGRYDVWDHDEDNWTIYINNFINTVCAKYGNDLAIDEGSNYVFSDSFFTPIRKQGKEITKYKQLINGANALRNAEVKSLFDRQVAVINSRVESSQFFESVVTRDPSVELLLSYFFSPHDKCWKFSCYSVEGKPASALEFINRFYEPIPKIINLGGHDRACGFSVRPQDINKFLKMLID